MSAAMRTTLAVAVMIALGLPLAGLWAGGRMVMAEAGRARGARLDHLCGTWHDGTFIALP